MTVFAINDLCPDRPFTNIIHTTSEECILAEALTTVRTMLSTRFTPATEQIWNTDEGYYRRLILGDLAQLYTVDPLTLVGFFGQRRAVADYAQIAAVDAELLIELGSHPGILAYYTLELADGQYGNLVLFASEMAKGHWQHCPAHAIAAQQLSPAYYHCVRIHNGYVPGGIQGQQAQILTCTKYYDYDGRRPWSSVRYL